MDTFTGHYPNDWADHGLRYAGVNTFISVFCLHEHQLVCSRYNPVPETSETEISLNTTEIVLFLPPLPCYVMLYGHASTVKKNLWNNIFCWVTPSPPPSKTASREFGPQRSLSPWSCLDGTRCPGKRKTQCMAPYQGYKALLKHCECWTDCPAIHPHGFWYLT